MSLPNVSIQEAASSIITSINAGDYTPILLLGQPGVGKSDVALQVSVHYGVPIELAKQLVFRPSLHDPVDLLGLPLVDTNGVTKFSGNKLFRLAEAVAKKYGIAIIVWDELPQAIPMMQNAITGALLDRRIGEQVLHPRVFQIATGNRVEDRAGSGRLLTHTANRMEILQLEFSLQLWLNWAVENTRLDPLYYAFFSFKGDSVCDFDPSRIINATPRAWTSMQHIPLPPDTSRSLFQSKLAGRVGVGIASEFCSFIDIYFSLPDPDETINNPADAVVPEDPSTIYALIGALAQRANDSNLTKIIQYGDRLMPEYRVSLLQALISRSKRGGFAQNKDFIAATIAAFDLVDPNAGSRS